MKFYEISCLFPYQTGIGTRVVLWTFVVPTYLNLRFETRTWNLSWDFLDLHFDIGFRIEWIVTGRPDLILFWLTWLLGPETWHQIEDWTRLDLDVSWLTWGLTWLVQVFDWLETWLDLYVWPNFRPGLALKDLKLDFTVELFDLTWTCLKLDLKDLKITKRDFSLLTWDSSQLFCWQDFRFWPRVAIKDFRIELILHATITDLEFNLKTWLEPILMDWWHDFTLVLTKRKTFLQFVLTLDLTLTKLCSGHTLKNLKLDLTLELFDESWNLTSTSPNSSSCNHQEFEL